MLLMTAATGAWADETLLLTIESRDYKTFKSGSKTFDDKVTITFSNEVRNDGDNWGWYANSTAPLLTVAGINGYTITSCKFYVEVDGIAKTGYTVEGESPSVYLSNLKVYTDNSQSVKIGANGVTKIEVYEAAPAPATYTVSLKDGVKDADKWTISPNPAEEGQTVTLQYTGRLKVKGVTATSDAPAEAKPAAMVTLPLGEMTQGGDPLNNGSGSETYSSPTFKEGDQIALVHGGVKDVVTVGKPNPDGSAPITGDITVGADNEDIVLVYPADLVDVAVGGTAYTENTDVTNKFNSQAGTLAYIQNNLYIHQGTGKLAVSGASASLKANVSMASQIAIWKLTMKDDYNDDIDAQKVTVKVGGKTVAYASTTSPYFSPNIVYLALNPATMGTGILRIEAEGLGDTYYIEKSGVSLTAGKFYQSTLNMSEE